MESIALLAGVLAIGFLLANVVDRYRISLPIVFVLVGLVFGERSLGWLSIEPEREVGKELTELTLGLLLFADASTLRIRKVVANAGLEGRLLSIGLLGSIGLGAVLAFLMFPEAEVGVVLILGAALAPTDAALGLPIFANTNIPERIRQALNVESGLNDGIATPFVTLFIGLAVAEAETGGGDWLSGALEELAIGIMFGLLIGALAGWAIKFALARDWTTTEMASGAFLASALTAFYGARHFHGNGFIAAFVGGLFVGWVLQHQAHELAGYAETTGSGLSFAVWAIFGAVFVPIAINDAFTWRAIVFAIAALTLMRMLPVALALVGTGLRRDTVAIMGWFGPRGLASVVFLVMAMVALEESGAPTGTLIAAMTWTIALSVIFHGVSAGPLGEWYGRRLEKADQAIPEFAELENLTR